MKINRRQFLKGASAASALASSHVLSFAAQRAWAGSPNGRILVLLNMSGGNDPLNTVIPVDDAGAPQRSVYDSVRPDLAISVSDLGATEIGNDPVLGTRLALHPQMTGLKTMFDEGKLAVVNGTGYPDSSLSHFDSEVIWWAGDTHPTGTGWTGRHLDSEFPDGALRAMSFGSSVNPSLVGLISDAIGVNNISRFDLPDDSEFRDLDARFPMWQEIYGDARPPGMLDRVTRSGGNLVEKAALFETIEVDGWGSLNEGAESGLEEDFQQIASILRHDQVNIGNPVNQTGLSFFHVQIGGFDTHSEQGSVNDDDRHARILRRVSNGMANFQHDLEALGLADRVCTVTYSEFGRRIAQNDSGTTAGTDHGRAGMLFVQADPSVLNGGVTTQVPDLTTADDNGNLPFNTDFRTVYADVINGWLGGDATNVLGADFGTLGLFV
jgi:uncharacterized protein (DUF1501 family)